MAQYNYKRMKELGRGTAGVVYLVRDRDDDSLWVEKVRAGECAWWVGVVNKGGGLDGGCG